MPLRWEILHPQVFVHIVAEGPVTLKEMEDHFDAIYIADAMPHAKLFDATNAEPIYSDEVEMTFRRFINISPSKRPAALFKTEAEAHAWLADKARA